MTGARLVDLVPVLLGVGWSLEVAVGAVLVAPGPARHRLDQAGRAERPPAVPRAPRPGPAERLGSWALARLRRRLRRAPQADPPDPALARRVGRAVLVTLAALPLLPPAAPAVALFAWAVPGVLARRAEQRRLDQIAADLPEVVDLLVVAVGAGLTVPLAVQAAGRRGSGPLARHLARAAHEHSLGRRLSEALEELPDRAGEATRPLVTALLACERYGAPLGPSLERLAGEARRDRRRRAEEAARQVPVKLLFPLVLCVLPAFALLTVAPLVASALGALRL